MEPPTKRPKRNAASFSAARILNGDSPVTGQDKNIQAFLALCLFSWTDYSEEEKAAIISTLPPSYQALNHDESGNLTCPIAPEFISKDKVIRDQIARFKREIRDGYHTKTWQEKAKKAMDDRSNGRFDDYLARHIEEMFNDEDDDDGDAGDQVSNVDSDGDYGTKGRRRARKVKGKGKSSMGKSDSFRGSDHIVPAEESVMLTEDGNSEMNGVAYQDRTSQDVSDHDLTER